MARSWCKVSASLDSHPKIRRAGNLGRQVFEFALRRNAEIDGGGVIPRSHLDPEYLADMLMLSGHVPGVSGQDMAVSGLSRAVQAGLLLEDERGYLIAGWDDEWGKKPLDEAERKRLQRARSRKDDMSRKCPDTFVTEPDVSGQSHIRGEEIRGEERESPPARDPAVPATEPTAPPAPTVPAVSRPAPVREDIARTQPIAGDQLEASKAQIPPAIPDTCRDRQVIAAAPPPFDPAAPLAIGRLAEATYRRVSDARIMLAAELRLPAPLPFPPSTPSTQTRGLVELRARIREEGAQAPAACDRVVANLTAQAREEGHVDWLSDSVFGDKAWPRARDWRSKKRPVAPRKTARLDLPKPIPPAERAGPADFAAARAVLGLVPVADRDTPALLAMCGDQRAGPGSEFPDDAELDQETA